MISKELLLRMTISTQSYSVYKILSILVIVVAVNCPLPPDTGTPVEEPFPKEKCESLLVNCTCYDYEFIAGIVCDGMNDFTNFTHLLATERVFKSLNVTYEITLNGIEFLPAKSLDGLTVFRLILENPDFRGIDENAFEGVLQLQMLMVRSSKIKGVPNFQTIRKSIRKINIDHSKLTSLDGDGLQNLELLETLSFVNNSIRNVHPDSLKGTENIVNLDLSMNLLTSLPSKFLNTMTKLQKLVLSYNQLLHVDGLFSITHPRFIFLDFNNLTNVDSILFPNMTNVETLILASNPITNVSEISFNGKVPELWFLYLDHCYLRNFNALHYKDLRQLQILDMKYNFIEEVGSQNVTFGLNVELDFNGNQIRKFEAELGPTVIRLFLILNKLEALGRTLHNSNMTEVYVSSNQLQYLSIDDFKGVSGMQNLQLQENRIHWIDRFAFFNLRNDLYYLDMSENLIQSLNGSVKYLSQLKLLNMSHNLIETFEEGEFTGLNELSELYLQNNRIKDLTGQLQLIPQLRYILITYNNISTITPEQIPEKLGYIYLAENPIQCNCSIMPFLQWLNTSDSTETDIKVCAPPTETERIQQRNLECPKRCTCACDKSEGSSFMSVNCSSRNMTSVPMFLTSEFSETTNISLNESDYRTSLIFEQSIYPSIHVQDRVLEIDLGNNLIESIDRTLLPEDLIHLYLSNNYLRMIPESKLYSLKDLKEISLSGNPWDCNCKAAGFKQWLVSKLDIVKDANNTLCSLRHSKDVLGNRVIWTLTDMDLCPAGIVFYVSITFGILIILLLCMAAKILYTKYEFHIKVYLYSHGVTWLKQKDVDYDKEFDAFISYSHKDEAFVTTEIIKLIEEKDANIRLCIHHKHFQPGEFIQDNIVRAVQKSKRTVLVLSKNFLESEWCLMEFRAAHVQALEDKLHRIVVIKIGDLPEEIDPAIKVYLDSTTYLEWGSKYFWNNLMYVLPTSSTPRNKQSQSGIMEMKAITLTPNSSNV